ncbi:MAG: NAD(P)/FAD-dependent oxidoreductase [Gemmatimonadales bacterium]
MPRPRELGNILDMHAQFDAAIVGAGPAGSATAAHLAVRGARVALIDRAIFPRAKPCAEYLSPGAVDALDRLGVGAALRRSGAATVRGMRIVAPDGTASTGRFPNHEGFALPRETLDQILAQHAADRGAVFLPGQTVVAYEPGPPWTLRLPGGSTLTADLLVGADGLHSRVARQTVGVHPGTSHRIALVTHYADVPGMSDDGEMHVTHFGYVGLASVGPSLVNISVVVDRRQGRPRADATAWFDALIASVPRVADRLAQGRRVEPVRGIGPFGQRARQVTGDRLLLVGDAAEFFDPFTGDGIWTALKGAELAAIAALTPDNLRGYAAARRRAFAGKWVVERAISAAVARPRLFNHIAHRLARRPALLDTLVGVTGHVVPASRALSPTFLLALVR